MSDSTIPTKKCTKCGAEYPATLEYFNRDKNGKSGLKSHCKKCERKYTQEWTQQNSQRKKETNHQHYWSDPEGERKKLRQRYNNNPEKYRKRSRQYRKENPEQIRINARNRRAHKHNAVGTHTPADIQNQLQSQKHHCYYCDKSIRKRYHVDHVIPLIRGGSNSPENLVCTCPRCNLNKKDKTLREWIEIIEDTTLYLRVAQRIVEREKMGS